MTGLVAALGVTAAMAGGLQGSGRLVPLADAGQAPRLYIVQLDGPPALAGTAWREAGLSRPDAHDARTRRHVHRLGRDHDAALRAVGAGSAKLYSYGYAFNGFAAWLTPAQAQKLALRRGVRQVWADRPKYVESNASPTFLGLRSASDGLWARRGLKGEGVVIGVIDSGIAPGHPSFSDTVEARRPRLCRSGWAETSLLGRWLCRRFKKREARLTYTAPVDWRGSCEAGEGFKATDCNHKLIGARWYVDGFLAQYALDANEFLSPRDADGHGTHIASTAAGNRVTATLSGTGVATVSGMAPLARVAVYKACWLEPEQLRGTCSTADLVRAIEDAVADGVDIINYSVGSYDDIVDADDIALLAALDAGVLSIAAAGNEGPVPGSMLSPAAAPWVVAVGAASRAGTRYREALRVTAPAALAGTYAVLEAGFTPRLRDEGPISAGLVRADDGLLGLFDGSLGTTDDACEALRNGSVLSGRIALVRRGGCTFEVKVRNAQNAGAVAVVVYSNQGEPLLMSGTRGAVSIPAVMISREDGERILARLVAGDSVELTLDKSLFLTVRDEGNVIQGFSARGPNLWAEDILKPDVIAPGLDILAGHTPDVANNVRGERFQYLSGTSMAVPHVAGIAALIRQAHPEWSPAAIRSALVTTARQDLWREDGETAADPFDMGGGHVVPNRAVDPGLVYDAATQDYDAFLCSRGQGRVDDAGCAALAAAGHPESATALNEPAIALSAFVHEQTVRRRVTNVGDAAQYVASVEAPSTMTVEVTPPLLSLATGESAEYSVRISGPVTTLDAWQFGALTWSDGSHQVRSPLAIQAKRFSATPWVSGSGASGSLEFEARFGYGGSYVAAFSGLDAPGTGQPDSIRAQLTDATVADDPANSYVFRQPGAGTLPASVRRLALVVPAGTRLLRVALRNEATDGAHDLDLYLYHCPGFSTCTEAADPSGNIDADETIDLLDPPLGDYYVDVHGYDLAAGATVATFDLYAWALGPDRGNAGLSAPATVAPGDAPVLRLDWSGLAAGPHLGLISHGDGSTALGLTLIEITD